MNSHRDQATQYTRIMATPTTRSAARHVAAGPWNPVLGRKQLLGAGVAALMTVLVPAGLAQAASKVTSKTASTAKAPASALLQGYPQRYQQHSLSCEAAVASLPS